MAGFLQKLLPVAAPRVAAGLEALRTIFKKDGGSTTAGVPPSGGGTAALADVLKTPGARKQEVWTLVAWIGGGVVALIAIIWGLTKIFGRRKR